MIGYSGPFSCDICHLTDQEYTRGKGGDRAPRGRELRSDMETDTLLDPVSGLPNRLLFFDRLTHAIAFARRHDTLLAVCSITIDMSGVPQHVARISREIGDRLHHTIREIDTVARLGLEEFGVVITDLHRREDGEVAIAKVGDILEQPYDIVDSSYVLQPRIGIAFYPAHGHDAAMLIDAARAARAAASPVAVFADK